MDAFRKQLQKSVELLRAETGEKMPREQTLKKEDCYTIDVNVNSKLLVNGRELVYDEDLYDVVAPAFKKVANDNPCARIGTLISKTKDMFGSDGPPEFKNFNINASLLKYLNPREPEPTAAAAAAVQPETAIVPVPAVTLNGASTSVPRSTAAATQPGTAVFSMEYRLNRDEERHRPVKQYRDALNASSTAAGVSRGPVGCLDLFWIRVAPSHFVRY